MGRLIINEVRCLVYLTNYHLPKMIDMIIIIHSYHVCRRAGNTEDVTNNQFDVSRPSMQAFN